jgi:hypothetical protein
MEDVITTLAALNSAWLDRRFDDLGKYFDEGIVMKGPGLKELARGRESLVQSYATFMSSSKVLDYAESNHNIDQWGSSAVASYDWSMTWEQGGKTESGSGQDMFVFERRDSGWIAVMRVMLF